MKSSVLLLIALILGSQQANPPLGPTIAQLLIEKGLAKINDIQRNKIRADLHSSDEDKGQLEEGDGIITGRPRLVENLSVKELYDAFGSRFEFYIDDPKSTQEINGKIYGVIKFRPKTGLNIRKTADQFINRVSGNVYMDLDTFFIARVDGSVENPFSFRFKYWFIPLTTVHVHRFEFSVEYTMFNNIAVEKKLSGSADFDHTYRSRGMRKSTYTLDNYRMIS